MHGPEFRPMHLNFRSVMKRHFENLAKRAGRMIRHWWMMLLVGILVIIAGILFFVFPVQSYMTLGVLFGILMLLSGAAQLVIASSRGNYLMMKGYVVIGGVIDLFLGIFFPQLFDWLILQFYQGFA